MSDAATAAGIPARRSAIHLLDQVLGEGRLMSECLGAGALDHLPGDDRARARLAAGGRSGFLGLSSVIDFDGLQLGRQLFTRSVPERPANAENS